MSFLLAVAVALAGAAGAVTRLVLDGVIRERTGSAFPWATVVINVTGSFALGVFAGLLGVAHGDATLLAVAGTGFCGGYTTFSTAAVETLTLLRTRRVGAAFAQAAGTLAVTVAAAWLGLALTRAW